MKRILGGLAALFFCALAAAQVSITGSGTDTNGKPVTITGTIRVEAPVVVTPPPAPPDPPPVTPPPVVVPTPTLNIQTFAPTDAVIANPERGWYRFGYLDGANGVTAAALKALRAEGNTLRLGLIDLSPWRTTATLPQSKLTSIRAALQAGRDADVKFIIRPVYNYASGGKDATLAIAQGHIKQLGPLFKEFADSIAFLQAGFIGYWGEWHDSSSGLSTTAGKRAIHDALRAAIAPSTWIQVRYPADLKAIGWPSLSGLHYDCIQSGDYDGWTYPGGRSDPLRAEANAQLDTRPMGGETCTLPNVDPNPRMTCAAVLSEQPAANLVYLNADYDTAFAQQWRREGCYDQVTRSMGYRIQLDRAELLTRAAAGATTPVTVDLRNVGWARIFSDRQLVATFTNAATGRSFSAGSSVRLSALPAQASESTRLQIDVAIPANAPAGDYQLTLSAPDVSPARSSRPGSAVQFANAAVQGKGQGWDAAAGRFNTGMSLAVSN